MLAFSLPSLFPYFILCLVLNTKNYCSIRFQIQASTLAKSSLIETAFNRQFEQQPSAVIARWSFPKLCTDHQLDMLDHSHIQCLNCISPDQLNMYLPTHLILVHDHYHLAFAFSLARSARDTTIYIWLRVAFVCSIPHRARRPAYYLVICMICH